MMMNGLVFLEFVKVEGKTCAQPGQARSPTSDSSCELEPREKGSRFGFNRWR